MSAACDSPLITLHEAAVIRAIEGMRGSLYLNIGLEDHASAGMYSRFHFHRVFRQVTGLTPARYLAGLRMQRAKQLLATTELTVSTISGLVGYESLGTFTTQFGRLVGMPPGGFRQLVDRCAGQRTLANLELLPCLHTLGPVCRASAGPRCPGRGTLAGLFPAGQPVGRPLTCALLSRLSSPEAAGLHGGLPTARIIALPLDASTDLVDLAVGEVEEVLCGPVTSAVSCHGGPRPGRPALRRRQPYELPLVSAGLAQFLIGDPA